jgi:hypothetical protein
MGVRQSPDAPRSMIRLLTDEHIPSTLVHALRDRGIDVTRVQDVGLSSTPDPDILEWAAAGPYVFVTFDRNTVPGFAHDRVRAGLPMPGVAVIDQALPIGTMADELHVIVACATADDLRDQVVYIPL